MSSAPFQPEPSDPGGLRVGDAERNAAAEALQQHLTSGRLTLDEYTDRSTVVSNARTQGELDRMFTDLPPIAGAPGAAGRLASTPASQPAFRAAASDPAVPERSNNRALLIGLMSAMPIIAVILFFVFDSWYFFLLIPLVGAVFGPMLNNGNDQGWGRNRNRNRNR